MLLAKTLIPQILDYYSVLPSIDDIKKNTSLCEIVNTFETEFSLIYDFKNVEISNDPLNELREFTKKFTLIAPTLDPSTILFFTDKIKNGLPKSYGEAMKHELRAAFNKASNINKPTSKPSKQKVPLSDDDGFLNKLAEALKQCASPCNYLEMLSDTIATLSNVGEAATSHTTPLWDKAFEFFQPPIFTTLNAFNKIATDVVNEVTKIFRAAESTFRNALTPNFTPERIELEQQQLSSSDQTLENTSDSMPFTNAISQYKIISKSGPNILNKAAKLLGDCFRLADYYKRFNYQDPNMNFGKSKRVLYNTNVNGYTVLTDIYGREVPPYQIAQSVTDLSTSGINPQAFHFDDIPDFNLNNTPSDPTNPLATNIDDKVSTSVNPYPQNNYPPNQTLNGISTSGEYNSTIQKIIGGDGVEKYTQLVNGPNGEVYAAGKIKTFGGNSDQGNQGNLTITQTTGVKNSNLKEDDLYFGFRADYDKTPLKNLRNSYYEFYNPKNGNKVIVPPHGVVNNPGTGFVDWGPHTNTECSLNISPGLARKLGVQTDGEIYWRRVPKQS